MVAGDYTVNPSNIVTDKHFEPGATTTDKFVYKQNSDA
jgi:hypothetical protein